MRKLKLFFACLLMAVLSIGQMWAGTMSVDFESAASAYTDWTITTITTQQTNSDVSAHGGSYFGSTDGKATGSIVTKAKVNPSSITFYYSKLSTNTKAASWLVKVSSDGTSWTEVDSKAAGNGVSKGTWYEFTTDLSSYSDVYVGVFYDGNTAARCLDDLVLTTADGGSDPVSVTGVALNKSELELEVDASETLTATVAPNDATNKTVSWESSNTAVATVTNGAVTAVAEGSATITVTTEDGSFTDECEVTVTAAAPAVEYVKFTGDIEEGDYVIYYGGKVVKNVVASNRLSYEEVTPVNDKIKNPSDAIIWHIAPAETEGYWTLYNENVSKYAVCTNSNNQANLNATATANALVTVSEVSEGSYEILSKARQDASSNNYYFRNNGTYGFAFYSSGTGGALTLYKNVSAAPAVAKPTISGTDNFLTSSEISMACTTEGADVYYTTDGSDPKTSGTKYTAAFSIEETKTIKAIAKLGDDWSDAVVATFTKATVMTVAEARAAIDAGGDLSNKFVAGIISQIDSYQSNYHSITYWISDDGTTTDQLEVYSGLAGVVKEQFESVNDLAVGDDVTVKGTLKKYNSTYEFDYNNTIEAYKPIARLAWSAESFDAALEGENTFPSLTNTNGVTVSYSSSDPTKASFADASVYEITLNAVGSTTITASFAGNETYKANSASYTLNVTSSLVTLTYNVDGGEAIDPVNVSALPNPLPTTTKAGKNFGGWFTDSEKEVAAVPGAAISENTTLYAKWLDPYTVAQAKAVIDANPTGTENQYVAGIISQIDSYNNTYHSITYWISADGTTTDQLQVYSGLIGNAATALEKEQFTAKTDLELGDAVVVTGTLKFHNNTTYEFDKNNSIYTFSRKESAGLAYAVTAVNKVVGDDAFVNELTNPNGVAVNYGTSDDQVAEVANDGTVTIVGEGSATITASFAGNEQYKAAQVSYTLTVSATVDTRHIANSPATFTTTNGNLDPDDIAYASYQGGSSTAPAIYNDGIRLYQISGSNDFGGFVTITAKTGCTIDEVQITTTSKYATTVAYSVDGNETLSGSESVAASSSYTTGTGLNVSSVNILNLGTGSSGRMEIASIKVYYTGEPASIHHYELGGTYQTAFMQDEEFNHTGLIVYAAYDALGENKVDITSMCTFSEPDMNTTGDKTIEITYNEAVVTSYTINVAADSRKVANSPATFTTVSGDMTPNDITFASYQGGAGTAPQNYNDGIRLYQAPSGDAIGGFITLKAKKGCSIDQVKITTTNSYATTVAYSVDGNENLLGSESVAKSSDYSTPSGLNVESVNIVNKGTGSSGRLEIASIKVWYTGDALSVDHYILGGTYETVFEQFGMFSYEGLTVTASYDAGETITEAVVGFTVEADLNIAGNKKANVMLNSVKIAEYDITVTASAKTDPALAYDPTSVILTLGDALSAPTFSNTYGVAVSYESDNEAVATVDAEGNIALAGGVGTAVITASFAGNEDYLASEATFTITVNAPAEDLSGTWVVATSIAAGDRIIIADVAAAGVVYTMGEQANNGTGNNRVAVESDVDEYGVLTPAAGTKTFLVVDVENGEFALQALNGNYLYAASNSSNHLKETSDVTNVNAKWTITIENGIATIKALHEGHNSRNWMRKNESSAIFSCYGSGQEDIVIYKRAFDYEREIAQGVLSTTCLPNGGVIYGASIFEVAYMDYEADGTTPHKIYFDEVEGGIMEAGVPYIVLANEGSEKFGVYYSDNENKAAQSKNGLVGYIGDGKYLAEDDYFIYNNMFYHVSAADANTRVHISNNRAYINLSGVPGYNNEPISVPAPGRRRVSLGNGAPKVATGIDALNASDKPVKMIIDGQLFILRGEKMYDVKGQLVK